MASAAQCDTSHTCFQKVGEPQHFDTHICFSKRVSSKLEPLQSAGAIAALEDAIAELQILYQTIPVDKNQAEEGLYTSTDERFCNDIVDPGTYWEFAGVWPTDLQAMLKLQKDREFTERVLRKTLEDLRCNNRYGTLRGAVALQNAKSADEKAIEEKLVISKRNELSCKELLASEKELMKRQDAFWEQEEKELLAAYHDTRLMSGLTLGFSRQWEETRRQQLNLMKHHQEANLQNEIDEILEDAQVQEERAHMEITSFLKGEHEYLKQGLDRWTDEYDEQVATRDTELNMLRQNKEANLESIEQAKREVEKRKEIKAEALELRDKIDKKNYALKQTTTIQAWWRGIYYRKNLHDKAIKLLKKKKKKKKGKGKKKK